MAEQLVEYKIESGISWHGSRYKSGVQKIPRAMALSLEMLKGKTRAEATKAVDALAKGESTAESGKEESELSLAGVPYSTYFEKAGVNTLEALKAVEDLSSVNGISDARATEVSEFLANLSDSEG